MHRAGGDIISTFINYVHGSYTYNFNAEGINRWRFINYIWNKVFKNGPSRICGRQPLKYLKRYGLLKQRKSMKGLDWVNHNVFWCFQEVDKRCIGNKCVKYNSQTLKHQLGFMCEGFTYRNSLLWKLNWKFLQLEFKFLTHFMPLVSFYTTEIVRKPGVFWCFLGL